MIHEKASCQHPTIFLVSHICSGCPGERRPPSAGDDPCCGCGRRFGKRCEYPRLHFPYRLVLLKFSVLEGDAGSRPTPRVESVEGVERGAIAARCTCMPPDRTISSLERTPRDGACPCRSARHCTSRRASGERNECEKTIFFGPWAPSCRVCMHVARAARVEQR